MVKHRTNLTSKPRPVEPIEGVSVKSFQQILAEKRAKAAGLEPSSPSASSSSEKLLAPIQNPLENEEKKNPLSDPETLGVLPASHSIVDHPTSPTTQHKKLHEEDQNKKLPKSTLSPRISARLGPRQPAGQEPIFQDLEMQVLSSMESIQDPFLAGSSPSNSTVPLRIRQPEPLKAFLDVHHEEELRRLKIQSDNARVNPNKSPTTVSPKKKLAPPRPEERSTVKELSNPKPDKFPPLNHNPLAPILPTLPSPNLTDSASGEKQVVAPPESIDLIGDLDSTSFEEIGSATQLEAPTLDPTQKYDRAKEPLKTLPKDRSPGMRDPEKHTSSPSSSRSKQRPSDRNYPRHRARSPVSRHASSLHNEEHRPSPSKGNREPETDRLGEYRRSDRSHEYDHAPLSRSHSNSSRHSDLYLFDHREAARHDSYDSHSYDHYDAKSYDHPTSRREGHHEYFTYSRSTQGSGLRDGHHYDTPRYYNNWDNRSRSQDYRDLSPRDGSSVRESRHTYHRSRSRSPHRSKVRSDAKAPMPNETGSKTSSVLPEGPISHPNQQDDGMSQSTLPLQDISTVANDLVSQPGDSEIDIRGQEVCIAKEEKKEEEELDFNEVDAIPTPANQSPKHPNDVLSTLPEESASPKEKKENSSTFLSPKVEKSSSSRRHRQEESTSRRSQPYDRSDSHRSHRADRHESSEHSRRVSAASSSSPRDRDEPRRSSLQSYRRREEAHRSSHSEHAVDSFSRQDRFKEDSSIRRAASRTSEPKSDVRDVPSSSSSSSLSAQPMVIRFDSLARYLSSTSELLKREGELLQLFIDITRFFSDQASQAGLLSRRCEAEALPSTSAESAILSSAALQIFTALHRAKLISDASHFQDLLRTLLVGDPSLLTAAFESFSSEQKPLHESFWSLFRAEVGKSSISLASASSFLQAVIRRDGLVPKEALTSVIESLSTDLAEHASSLKSLLITMLEARKDVDLRVLVALVRHYTEEKGDLVRALQLIAALISLFQSRLVSVSGSVAEDEIEHEANKEPQDVSLSFSMGAFDELLCPAEVMAIVSHAAQVKEQLDFSHQDIYSVVRFYARSPEVSHREKVTVHVLEAFLSTCAKFLSLDSLKDILQMISDLGLTPSVDIIDALLSRLISFDPAPVQLVYSLLKNASQENVPLPIELLSKIVSLLTVPAMFTNQRLNFEGLDPSIRLPDIISMMVSSKPFQLAALIRGSAHRDLLVHFYKQPEIHPFLGSLTRSCIRQSATDHCEIVHDVLNAADWGYECKANKLAKQPHNTKTSSIPSPSSSKDPFNPSDPSSSPRNLSSVRSPSSSSVKPHLSPSLGTAKNENKSSLPSSSSSSDPAQSFDRFDVFITALESVRSKYPHISVPLEVYDDVISRCQLRGLHQHITRVFSLFKRDMGAFNDAMSLAIHASLKEQRSSFAPMCKYYPRCHFSERLRCHKHHPSIPETLSEEIKSQLKKNNTVAGMRVVECFLQSCFDNQDSSALLGAYEYLIDLTFPVFKLKRCNDNSISLLMTSERFEEAVQLFSKVHAQSRSIAADVEPTFAPFSRSSDVLLLTSLPLLSERALAEVLPLIPLDQIVDGLESSVLEQIIEKCISSNQFHWCQPLFESALFSSKQISTEFAFGAARSLMKSKSNLPDAELVLGALLQRENMLIVLPLVQEFLKASLENDLIESTFLPFLEQHCQYVDLQCAHALFDTLIATARTDLLKPLFDVFLGHGHYAKCMRTNAEGELELEVAALVPAEMVLLLQAALNGVLLNSERSVSSPDMPRLTRLIIGVSDSTINAIEKILELLAVPSTFVQVNVSTFRVCISVAAMKVFLSSNGASLNEAPSVLQCMTPQQLVDTSVYSRGGVYSLESLSLKENVPSLLGVKRRETERTKTESKKAKLSDVEDLEVASVLAPLPAPSPMIFPGRTQSNPAETREERRRRHEEERRAHEERKKARMERKLMEKEQRRRSAPQEVQSPGQSHLTPDSPFKLLGSLLQADHGPAGMMTPNDTALFPEPTDFFLPDSEQLGFALMPEDHDFELSPFPDHDDIFGASHLHHGQAHRREPASSSRVNIRSDPLNEKIIRDSASTKILGTLKEYLENGKIASKDDFRHLARRVTREFIQIRGSLRPWDAESDAGKASKFAVSYIEKLLAKRPGQPYQSTSQQRKLSQTQQPQDSLGEGGGPPRPDSGDQKKEREREGEGEGEGGSGL